MGLISFISYLLEEKMIFGDDPVPTVVLVSVSKTILAEYIS